MSTITLPRNVQFLYEAQLARFEARALGCDHWRPNENDLRQVSIHVNGYSRRVLRRAAYVGTLNERPAVYEQLIRPKFQGGAFNRTRSVNQYLTHWIYPYTGKFHPQMVRALLNIVGAQPGAVVLDPQVGERNHRTRGVPARDPLRRRRYFPPMCAADPCKDPFRSSRGPDQRSRPNAARGEHP